MRLRIDARSVLTYAWILLVGTFLLLLVTPNLPLSLVTIISATLPLIALGLLLTYIFGKSRISPKPVNRQALKILSLIAIVAIVLSVIITFLSTKQQPFQAGTLRYIFENIGVALLFTASACTLVLINLQKFLYWPFWNTNDKARSDERQKAVRQRIFEKTYRYNILILFIALQLAQIKSQRMRDEIIQVAILCLLGLPALIAATQKDS